MQKGILTLAVLVAIASLLIGVRVNIQESQKPFFENQLAKVSESQKNIETRLSGIEAEQKNILKAIEALPKTQRMADMPQRPAEDPNKVFQIPVGNSLIKGNKEAPVTIVEFSDFQCPFSKRFHTVIDEVLKAYPNEVKFIFKNFPLGFHDKAKPAAKAALAAGEQGKYWEMLDALFVNQQSLSDEKYVELAKEIGLNVDKFKKDLKDKDAQFEKVLQDDMGLGVKVEVPGTPAFYLNGKKTRARDLQSFKSEIDAILKK